MRRKAGRVEAADARDRDYGHDWKDHAAWSRWKKDESTLQRILYAKERGLVAALPMLLEKCREDSEEGGEALDAVFVIIKKNPGDREILSMFPELLPGLGSPESMFDSATLISAIAEVNPEECRSFQKEILDAMRAINDMESSLDVRMTLQELSLTLGYLGDRSVQDFLVTLLSSRHCDLSGEFEGDIIRAMRMLQR